MRATIFLIIVSSYFVFAQDFKHSVTSRKVITDIPADIYSDITLNRKIGSFFAGDTLTMIGWGSHIDNYSYFVIQVNAHGIIGYIPSGILKYSFNKYDSVERSIDGLLKNEKNEKNEKLKLIQQQKVIEAENRIIKLKNEIITKFGAVSGKRILNGEIWIGMTSDMAIYSIGEPDKVNRTVTANKVKEQWVYRASEAYLYFENKILTSYQDSK